MALFALLSTLLAAAPALKSPAPPAKPAPPLVPSGPVVRRYAFVGLDVTPAELAAAIGLATGPLGIAVATGQQPPSCLADTPHPSGRLDCKLPENAAHLERVQALWDADRVVTARALFDAKAPPAANVVKDLVVEWGPPSREVRLWRDERWIVEWEDGERKATLESHGRHWDERPVALTLERKPPALTGELSSLRLHPFAPFRLNLARRVDYDGVPHALVWGTSLSAAEEAAGPEASSAERGYVAIYRFDKATRRWHALWDLATGDDETGVRLAGVEVEDVSADGLPDLVVRLACKDCGASASEVYVKTVRGGRVVDLLAKRDLYRAEVKLARGEIRLIEPADQSGGNSGTTAVYGYDRGKGTFVLMREETHGGDDAGVE